MNTYVLSFDIQKAAYIMRRVFNCLCCSKSVALCPAGCTESF